MKTKNVTRKQFLSDVSKWSAAVMMGSTWLGACGGSTEQTEEASESVELGSSVPEDLEPEQLPVGACDDLSGLTEQEIALREQLQYVAQTPKEEQICANCRFWLPAEQEGACGGCQLIKGPIHPNGWCQSWVALVGDS